MSADITAATLIAVAKQALADGLNDAAEIVQKEAREVVSAALG